MKTKVTIFTLAALLFSGCGGGGGSSVTANLAQSSPATAIVTTPVVVTPTPTPVPVPDPTNVIFFRDDAVSGGNGSSATPFNDFGTALAATQSGQTLYVYAGSGNPILFTGTVPAGIVLHGEGVALTTSGAFALAAGTFPRLQGQVTLGTGTVVRGVQFENPAGNAVVGGSGCQITQCRFAGISGNAVTFDQIAGDAFVLDSVFADDAASDPVQGIEVALQGSQTLNLVVRGNTFSTPQRANAFDNGVNAVLTSSAVLNLTAENNSFDVQGRGLFLQARDSASIRLGAAQNTFTQSPLDGISVITGTADTDTSGSNLSITNNTFTQSVGPGVTLIARGAGQSDWTLQNNALTSQGSIGFLMVRSNSAVVRSVVTQNTLGGASQAAIQYTSGTASGGFTVPLLGEDRLTISGNTISGAAVAGINLNLVSLTHAALLLDNTSPSPFNVLCRGVNSCFGAGNNAVGGAFTATVETGFSTTYDDRGQTNPAVTFPGSGTVSAGPCNP